MSATNQNTQLENDHVFGKNNCPETCFCRSANANVEKLLSCMSPHTTQIVIMHFVAHDTNIKKQTHAHPTSQHSNAQQNQQACVLKSKVFQLTSPTRGSMHESHGWWHGTSVAVGNVVQVCNCNIKVLLLQLLNPRSGLSSLQIKWLIVSFEKENTQKSIEQLEQ